MSILLLRLAGMQSWDTQSRFDHREAGLDPSKSGVVGIIAAALGLDRDAPLDHLAALRMGVRVDAEGKWLNDYQTAGGSPRRERRSYTSDGNVVYVTMPTHTRYLMDADFLVGLEGDDGLLRDVARALESPKWPLYLGRRSCPVTGPLLVGDGPQVGLGLVEVLKAYPWPRPDLPFSRASVRPPTALRAVLEVPPDEADEVRSDRPFGTSFRTREFLPRHVKTEFWPLGGADGVPARGIATTGG